VTQFLNGLAQAAAPSGGAGGGLFGSGGMMLPLLAMFAALVLSGALAFAGHFILGLIRSGDYWRAYPLVATTAVYASALAACAIALLLIAGYLAALLWSQLWLAETLGAPVQARMGPALAVLLTVNAGLLAWRILMRACFTGSAYGWREGLLSIPRLVVGNVIAMLAAARALSLHLGGGARKWDKTRHTFPAKLPQ